MGWVPREELRLPQSKGRESEGRMEARRPERRLGPCRQRGKNPNQQRIDIEWAVRARP